MSFKTRDCEIMQWRVRLYCGHIVMTSRNGTVEDPTMHGLSSMRCPECGKEPARIVAYEPVGLSVPRPNQPPTSESCPPEKRPTRKHLEARIIELEAELNALRRNSDD